MRGGYLRTHQPRWCVVLLLLYVAVPASAAYNRSGLANAWPGAKCTTEEGVVATATLTDMERVTSVGASGDEAARRLLFERGIAITLRRLTVFAVERELNYAKIRPEGRLDTLWVRAWERACAK
jgi:hypothetical protein